MNTIFDAIRYVIAYVINIIGINFFIYYLQWLDDKWNFEIRMTRYEQEIRKASLDILNRLNKKLD